MKIELEKATGRAKCRNPGCRKKPEYINEKGRIKTGTTCAVFLMRSAAGRNASFYCRDCIELIYEDIKKILNPKLWVFH